MVEAIMHRKQKRDPKRRTDGKTRLVLTRKDGMKGFVTAMPKEGNGVERVKAEG